MRIAWNTCAHCGESFAYTPRRGPAPKYCRDKACRSAAYYARHRRVCLERTYRWRAANADRVRRYERERRKTARGA